jgi:hypothetical protein
MGPLAEAQDSFSFSRTFQQFHIGFREHGSFPSGAIARRFRVLVRSAQRFLGNWKLL